MQTFSHDAINQASIAIIAQLLETLKQTKTLTPDQIADLLNAAIADSKNKPNAGEIASVIHAMVGSK